MNYNTIQFDQPSQPILNRYECSLRPTRSREYGGFAEIEPLVSEIVVLTEQGNVLKNNEDSFYADADMAIAGVFDGASDIVGYKTPDGHTGGACASKIATETLRLSEPQIPLEDVMLSANQAIADLQSDLSLDTFPKEARFCTSGVIARIRKDETGTKVIDLAQIQDSVALVVYADGRTEAPLGLHDHDEETMELWTQLVAEGLIGSQIMQDQRMKDQIRSKRKEANVTYGTLNGEPEAANFIATTTIPAEGVSKIILLSDGLFLPKEEVRQPENWAEYAKLEAIGGIQAIHSHVRALEATDPECTRYPRFKVGDDKTGIVMYL